MFFWAPHALLRGAEITLTAPQNCQVTQRTSTVNGTVHIAGVLSETLPIDTVFEARLLNETNDAEWQTLNAKIVGQSIEAKFEGLAGGWYRLEVRGSLDQKMIAQTAVEHVGIGELFVVAGQSTSANHGEEKLVPTSGRVLAFDGKGWRLTFDPQPGASGGGGNFIPVFGDALAEKFDVPIGIVACGIGATSVREWLQKGSTFPNPPTIENRVTKLPSGESERPDAHAYGRAISRVLGESYPRLGLRNKMGRSVVCSAG